MNVTKLVTVEMPEEKLVGLVVNALYSMYSDAKEDEGILYRALSSLVGCTDVEAVKKANRLARERGWPTITTDDFRKWLPQVLAEAFAKLLRSQKKHECRVEVTLK